MSNARTRTYRQVSDRDALRRGGLLQLDLLLQPGVAVAGVAPRAEPPRSHLRVHLLHHLSKVGRREGFQVVHVAVIPVGVEAI